jgi:hypothetical protein
MLIEESRMGESINAKYARTLTRKQATERSIRNARSSDQNQKYALLAPAHLMGCLSRWATIQDQKAASTVVPRDVSNAGDPISRGSMRKTPITSRR